MKESRNHDDDATKCRGQLLTVIDVNQGKVNEMKEKKKAYIYKKN